MDLSKKIVILTVLFFCMALLNYLFKPATTYEYSGTKVITDFHLPGWQDVDLPNDDKILHALETDSTIFKSFTNNNGEKVTLYVGHYKKLEKAKLSHSPKVCFTAQGWVMSDLKHMAPLVDGEVLHCTAMIVRKGDTQELVYYWYQFDDKTFDELYKMKLALLAKKFRGVNEDNLFVRLTTPVLKGVDESSRVLKSFYRSLSPKIMNCFFCRTQPHSCSR